MSPGEPRGPGGKAAIAGVGYTPFSRDSGVTTTTLAGRAVMAALADAGLTVGDVDGLVTYSVGDSVGPNELAPVLGIRDLAYQLHMVGGGSICQAAIGNAVLAIASGVATTVVCYRALNSRSGVRVGGALVSSGGPRRDAQYRAPYGLFTPAQEYALAARQHMARYGTTSEQLGSIAVAQRDYAVDNERAMMRKPITLTDYLKARWIAEPLRLLDCCLETDGACALVVTGTDRARDLRQVPVIVAGAAWALGHSSVSAGWPDLTESAAIHTSRRLYAMAGLGPQDLDLAELYDCFTYSVLVQLEDFGLCPKGDGGPFAASGAISRGGACPVNTHGGALSEGYIHGLNHTAEAVLQLRHEAGSRQVPDAEVALVTGQAGIISGETSALILRRG
jgi:acetyl-CoA acetyltransferase